MRILVIGAGISGQAAARLAGRRGTEVLIYDQDPAALGTFEESGVRAVSGEWNPELTKGVDVVVVSPGIPPHAAPIVDCLAAGLEVWSELEFAARHTDVPIVAVTGTNGKTTTALLIADMLVRSGRKAAAVGNIGTALSEVADEAWDALVVEASSFQLRFIVRFHPHVAVVLNVAEDHLDWHGTIDAYRRAKARITENQGPDDVFVYDADDQGAVGIAAWSPSRLMAVSGTTRASAAGVRSGALETDTVGVPLTSLAISDPAYLVDLAAAAVAAEAVGASPSGISEGLLWFRPGQHRRTLIADREGVAWVDDSKATNPHAALASLEAFPSVVLIAGGRNKGLDLAPVVAHPHLRAVVAIGEAAEELEASARVPAHRAESVEAAVEQAGSLARRGDTVLLAPGCASFDMFTSYAARGDAFAAAVRERVGV